MVLILYFTLLSGATEQRIMLPVSHKSRNHRPSVTHALGWSHPWRTQAALSPSSLEEPCKRTVPCLVLANSFNMRLCSEGKNTALSFFFPPHLNKIKKKRLRHLFSRGLRQLAFLNKASLSAEALSF